MKNSVVWPLIWKDVRLQRLQLAVAFAAAMAALALVETKGGVPAVLGATWFLSPSSCWDACCRSTMW